MSFLPEFPSSKPSLKLGALLASSTPQMVLAARSEAP
jgi:hypothetical protein